MKKNLALFSMVSMIGACGTQANDDTQKPSAPMGSIVGSVTEMRTGAPLAGATVWILIPGGTSRVPAATRVSAVTDATGAYVLTDLPAGVDYSIHVEASGHVSRIGDVLIPSAAGNFPVDNAIAIFDTALPEANASITGKVYADGVPADGAVIDVDLRPNGYDLVVSATVAPDGTYTLGGLPGAPGGLDVDLVVRPYDFDGNGTTDFESLPADANTYPSTTTYLDLDLTSAAVGLALVSSDVADGRQAPNAPIRLVWNRPIDPASLVVSLTDLTTNSALAFGVSVDSSGTIVTLTSAGPTWPNGDTLRLAIAATATNGASKSVTEIFEVVPDATTSLGNVTGLAAMPTDADWTTRTFGLSWNAVAGARGYAIYVRDTYDNPNYLRLTSVGDAPAPSATITLPAAFDYFGADGYTTPFLFSTAVDIAVVPIDANGAEGSPTTAAAVRITDTTDPSYVSVAQSGTPDNTGSVVAKTIQVIVSFDEYVDPGRALPVLTSSVSGVTSTFSLDDDLLGGVFTLTIPAGVNGGGNFNITGGFDTSGNPLPARSGVLRNVIELVTNGGFEGPTCTLNGWTPVNNGSASAPLATSTQAASGSCSAQVGNTTAFTQFGTTSIAQTITLPAAASSIQLSMQYYPYTNNTVLHDPKYCYLTTSGGGYLTQIFSNATNGSTWIPVTADLTSYAGLTVVLVCAVDQDGSHISGMYVDQVSVLVTP